MSRMFYLLCIGVAFFANPLPGASNPHFGPFIPLTLNEEVVEEVFAHQGKILVLLKPEFGAREIRVKASGAESSQYRKWDDGGLELTLPRELPLEEEGEADWVETTAKYVEYWMDEDLILHLERVRLSPNRPVPKEKQLAEVRDLGGTDREPAVSREKVKGEVEGATDEDEKNRFGPYVALVMNREIVRDVRVDEELNTYIKLNPEHRFKEIRVKLSNFDKAAYREWVYGGYELVSPANAGRPPNGWTDWIQVQARYVEYWMEDELFLHLKRTDI